MKQEPRGYSEIYLPKELEELLDEDMLNPKERAIARAERLKREAKEKSAKKKES